MERKDLKKFVKAFAFALTVLYIVSCITKGFWEATIAIFCYALFTAVMIVITYYAIRRNERRDGRVNEQAIQKTKEL